MEWINIEDKTPKKMQEVAFIVASDDKSYNGRRLAGRYQGFQYGYHEFTTPGCGWKGSHWLPLPDLPLELNQAQSDADERSVASEPE